MKIATETLDRLAIIDRSIDDFDFFIHNVFAASFDVFYTGEYLHDVARHIGDNPNTISVTGRDHFKSTRLYARIMWALLAYADKGFEGHYFSYIESLASYHLSKVKEMVKNNPYYEGIIDNKPQSDGIIDFSWTKGSPRLKFKPQGLLSFKRGIHADFIYVDDPLRDPENKLEPTSIRKINMVIKAEVLSMVNKGGECRVVGTPQTWEDFFFDTELAKEFDVWITPAILDEPNQTVLWPEWHDWDWLMKKKNMLGEKIFNQEYMASPAYAEDAYIGSKALTAVINPDLVNLKVGGDYPELKNEYVMAGFDIGKKTHPSHFAIFKRKQIGDTIKYKQLHSKWMDGWDYADQIDYINEAIRTFNISILRYDNTRGEFEGFVEQKKLSERICKPMVFNLRMMNAYAGHMESVINQGRIELLNDPRQTNQIKAVNNDLKAMESPEGHGDSFWSTALGLYEELIPQPKIRSLH